jgi:hypothetical protein
MSVSNHTVPVTRPTGALDEEVGTVVVGAGVVVVVGATVVVVGAGAEVVNCKIEPCTVPFAFEIVIRK